MLAQQSVRATIRVGSEMDQHVSGGIAGFQGVVLLGGQDFPFMSQLVPLDRQDPDIFVELVQQGPVGY
jgi:hypothetical protein